MLAGTVVPSDQFFEVSRAIRRQWHAVINLSWYRNSTVSRLLITNYGSKTLEVANSCRAVIMAPTELSGDEGGELTEGGMKIY